MVLERDEKVLQFLELFKVATSNQVNQVEYHNQSICCRRLRKMSEDKLIFRYKNGYGMGYVYSYNPQKSFKQLKHKLMRVDFYLKLREGVIIDTILVEQDYGSIRPDLVLTCQYLGNWHLILVEIETSNNTINTFKYNNFLLQEYKTHFNVRPLIVYVTSKRINDARFNYVKVNPNLDNILDIFSLGS